LVKDIPMIIHLQFGFSQFINFREEDLWNFSQSEHIIGHGSHHIQHGFAPYQITLIWLYWYAEYHCWWPLAWSSELVISFLVHLDQRSFGGGHLGFPINIKNSNLVKDIPMIIHLQFGFNQFISFREEDLWNFSQSEHIIGPGSHVEYPGNPRWPPPKDID
jgi:hypothetical protein